MLFMCLWFALLTSAPPFDAIVWLITWYSPPRNTGKLPWLLFWDRDFENKKRPWQNTTICQGRITYKYIEYDTIRGATLIHRIAPMRLAGYQHIPGNWRMPTRCRILGVNKCTLLTAPSAVHLTTCFSPDSQQHRLSVKASLPLSPLQRFIILNWHDISTDLYGCQ